jgi:hypothetical protein
MSRARKTRKVRNWFSTLLILFILLVAMLGLVSTVYKTEMEINKLNREIKMAEDEATFDLKPDCALSNEELTELIMIQNPRIRASTYNRLSPELKAHFKKTVKKDGE